ncbi:MAG: hypothetical protein IJ537_09940 [Bacteroidaceae bacterium]|nr:hypothetical protein [Bacteroidaceae bacterium]MBQ9170326.1 hypothetical protein [Bacteroidaceae bacterium]
MMNNVSIIVTCEEKQQAQLRQLLPRLLSIQHEGEYEVIVVDKMHDKDLDEWLEDMEVQFSQLSHTFCPASSRGLDVQRLAITLGAKAAVSEMLIILPVGVDLPTGDWLCKLMSQYDSSGSDVVVFTMRRGKSLSWFRRIFHRTFSVYAPTTSIILSRRSILLKEQVVKMSNCKFIKCSQFLS